MVKEMLEGVDVDVSRDKDVDESSRAPTTQPSRRQFMVLWDGHTETTRDSAQSRGHSIRVVDRSRCEKTKVVWRDILIEFVWS